MRALGRSRRDEIRRTAATTAPRLDRGLLSSHIGPRVRLLRNLIVSRVTAALAPFGLSQGALAAMALITANARCSQMEIARELAVEKSAVAAIIEDLVTHGLVARSRSSEDRRRNLLALTTRGKRTMHTMHAAASAAERPMERTLSAAELARLLALLDRAYAALAATKR